MIFVEYQGGTRGAVQVGSGDQVEIVKEFGPAIFDDIRITASVERGGWLIERKVVSDVDCSSAWQEEALVVASME